MYLVKVTQCLLTASFKYKKMSPATLDPLGNHPSYKFLQETALIFLYVYIFYNYIYFLFYMIMFDFSM